MTPPLPIEGVQILLSLAWREIDSESVSGQEEGPEHPASGPMARLSLRLHNELVPNWQSRAEIVRRRKLGHANPYP